jgi:light-regulated signal transduction histidine kinase (bacteriophytochrome)
MQPLEARASAAEMELQAFSYIVSHDLATSFRHVSEFSRLLLGELGDGLTGPQQSHAEHIRNATDRCQLMMDQLLLFSRVQQKTLEPARQDATSAMRMAMMRLNIADDGASGVSLDPLGEVFADTELLIAVFQHLLDNALKFRRPGVAPRISIAPRHDRRSWRVRITDNGLGVEPEFRARTFEMFRRLNGEAAYPGVGAGLAISRRIARRHGGELAFLDCLDGACIELALPCAPTFQ